MEDQLTPERIADFWTDEDMTPIEAAIAAGNAALAV